MKIIGLGCGRKKGNSEMLLRAALKEAVALSKAEAELIRLQELTIFDCIGCESCMRGLTAGGDGKCVLRGDDFRWLAEKLASADGIILAVPIYNLIPTGSVITLLNRSLGIGKEYQMNCRANPKIGAAIGQGGSDWINFAEPFLDLTVCNLSKGAIMVDRMVYGHATAPAMVVLDTEIMDRAKLLGRRVGEALLAKEKAAYQGSAGICPVCHGKLLEFRGDDLVNCPYCNAEGTLTITAGKVKIRWNQNSLENHRFSPAGEQAHRAEIGRSHKYAALHQEKIRDGVSALENFGGSVLTPKN
ncbi:MAG: NAD(P)H-dependent oxidoreductase [Oscillospiraceae bacterium]